MNNFEVTKISLENIKSYIYKEIPFVNGNNVIIGENGAGKSTILESIYLALFGETLSKKYLADMIRFGEKQGKITLHFTLNDLKYRIEDEIIRRDEHRANQYPVLYNESIEETIAEGKMAVKAKIEEILNIDSNTFLSAVYATQGEIGEIITTSSNDRKKLFDKLFQIEKYESAYKNLRKMINKIEQVIKLLNTKMTAQKEDIKRLPSIKEILTKQQNALKKSKEDLKNLQNQYEEISKKYQLLKKLMKKHTSLIATIEQLKKYIKSLETEKENFLLHITELLENNVEDSFSIKKIQNIHSRIKKDIKKNKEELNSTTKKLEKLRLNLQDLQNLEKECNSVQKQIKGLKNDIQESKDKYLNLIPSLPEDLTIWQRKINTLIEEKHKLLNEKEKTEKEIIEMERTHDKLYLKIEDINEHLSKNNMKSVKTRFQIAKAAGDNWDKLIDNLLKAKIKDELAALKEKITAIQEKSEETRNKTAKISSQLSKIKENIQHLKNLEEGETCPTCKQTLTKELRHNILDDFTTEKKDLLKQKQTLKNTQEIINSNLEQIDKQKEELEKKQVLKLTIKPLYEDLKNLEKEKIELQQEQEKYEKKKRELRKKIPKKGSKGFSKEIASLIENIQKLRSLYEDLPKLETNIDKKDALLANKKSISAKLQEMKKKTNKSIEKKLQQKIQNLKAKEKNLGKLEGLFSRLIETKIKIHENRKELAINQKELDKIIEKDEFNKRTQIEKRWSKLSNEISSKKTAIEKISKEIIPPLKEQKADLEKKQKDFEKTKEMYQKEKKKLHVIKLLRKIMRDLPKRLLPQYIEQINATATKILQSLLPGNDIQGIRITQEYDIEIIRLGNPELVSVLSGGETIIIALALKLAFTKEFSPLNTLILDEPTIYLDELRRAELVSVLEKNRLVNQLFVVTHDQDFERIADKTYFIKKERNRTKVRSFEFSAKKKVKTISLSE